MAWCAGGEAAGSRSDPGGALSRSFDRDGCRDRGSRRRVSGVGGIADRSGELAGWFVLCRVGPGWPGR